MKEFKPLTTTEILKKYGWNYDLTSESEIVKQIEKDEEVVLLYIDLLHEMRKVSGSFHRGYNTETYKTYDNRIEIVLARSTYDLENPNSDCDRMFYGSEYDTCADIYIDGVCVRADDLFDYKELETELGIF